jgi:hypothetical protein
MEKVSAGWGIAFGAIGAAAAAANAKHFIFAADENSIRVFNIDKSTGVYYNNSFSDIRGEDVVKASVSGYIGGKNVAVKTLRAGTLRYQIPNKRRGFAQKDEVAHLALLLKTRYAKKK